MTKLLKIQYLSHLQFKIFQIAFIESYSLRVIQKYEKGQRHCGLGDLNVTNKTNKQSSFIDKYQWILFVF
jgi:hypothetical protein